MQKIPSLFVRDYETIITSFKPIAASTNSDGSTTIAGKITGSKKGRFLATNQVTPGCEWVINGEGTATRKWDGTACMVKHGILYKRYDAKHGKIPPEGFIPCQEPDAVTGHWPGWLKVGDGPEDRWIREAFDSYSIPGEGIDEDLIADGTYEAIGPKIGGNKEGWAHHTLIKHSGVSFFNPPRDFEGLKQWLSERHMEGLVFHQPDGRMCKIKRSDFGLKW